MCAEFQRAEYTSWQVNHVEFHICYLVYGMCDFCAQAVFTMPTLAVDCTYFGSGDDDFRAGLAQLYRKQRGKRASFADVRAAFENAADKELGPFFKQWVERPGAPAGGSSSPMSARTRTTKNETRTDYITSSAWTWRRRPLRSYWRPSPS